MGGVKTMVKEHEIIIKHLRKSRELGKHILTVVPETGSAIISHKVVIKTVVSERINVESEIKFLPLIRLYKTGRSKIVDNENLLNEDVENGY